MIEYSAFTDWPESGFPGIAINPETLLSQVVDEQACEEALQETSEVAAHVFVLLARGENSKAAELLAESRLAEPNSLPLRILEADLSAAVHENERAIRRLRNLSNEFRGSELEAVIWQHLGRAYFGAAQYQAAVDSFAIALEQRVAAGSAAPLIYSSAVALHRAREMASCADSVA